METSEGLRFVATFDGTSNGRFSPDNLPCTEWQIFAVESARVGTRATPSGNTRNPEPFFMLRMMQRQVTSLRPPLAAQRDQNYT